MSILNKRRYCYLYPKSDQVNLSGDIINAYKILREPYIYHSTYYNYELLIDEPISDNPQYVNLQDYDLFWELVYSLRTDPSFFLNGTYTNYGASDVRRDVDYLEFVKDNQEWKIYSTYNRFATEYPVPYHYYIFYDDNETIESNEMYPVLSQFCDRLGKENKYTGVKVWIYQDPNKTQKFYVFYYGDLPSDVICRLEIRKHLVDTLGYTTAKQRFPNLFIDTIKLLYILFNNECYPLDYEKLKSFVDTHDIFHAEVVNILDWRCPLIVSGGLSDIVPNFSPIEEEGNEISNQWLFYTTKVLNYLDGTVLTQNFRIESNFSETDEYCSFIYLGIEWRILKQFYRPPSSL